MLQGRYCVVVIAIIAIALGIVGQTCYMIPNFTGGFDSSNNNHGTDEYGGDGNDNTVFEGSTVGAAWMVNLTRYEFVNTISVKLYVEPVTANHFDDTNPGSITAYTSASGRNNLCPGPGWFALPPEYSCDIEDNDLFIWNNVNRNVRSVCFRQDTTTICPPLGTDVVWEMSIREADVLYTCSTTSTRSLTPSISSSPSSSVSNTPSRTPSSSASPSRTASSSASPSRTPSRTASRSRTATSSRTPSRSPSVTPSSTASRSVTPTRTISASSTGSRSLSSSVTPTSSISSSVTSTRTDTPSASITDSNTPSGTPSPSSSETAESSETPSRTPSSSVSETRTISHSSSSSKSSSASRTASRSSSKSYSSSKSGSKSNTESPSISKSISKSESASITSTTSATPSATTTPSSTGTQSPTPSATKSSSSSVSISITALESSSKSRTPSKSSSVSISHSISISVSSSVSISPSVTGTTSPSESSSITGTGSITMSRSASSSISESETPSSSTSPSGTLTRTPSPSRSPSKSVTETKSPTRTGSASKTSRESKSPSHTVSTSITITPGTTPSSSSSGSSSPTVSSSPSRSSSPSTSDSTTISISFSSSISTTVSPSIVLSESSSISTSVSSSSSFIIDLEGPTDDIESITAIPSAQIENTLVLISNQPSCTSGCIVQGTVARQNEVIRITGQGGAVLSIITANVNVLGQGNTLQADLVPSSSFPAGSLDTLTANGSLDAVIVDVSLVNADGTKIQPQGDVELCFSTQNEASNDQCLAVFNELENIWECEDACLKMDDNGLICGDTSHFSRFSILLDPNGAGNKDCSGEEWNGITHIQWVDYVIIVSVFLFVYCCAIIFIIITLIFPKIHGKEFSRMQGLRSSASLRIVETSEIRG